MMCSWRACASAGCSPFSAFHLKTNPLAQELPGAEVRFGSVLDKDSLRQVAFKDPVDVVVSCLASRTGEPIGSSPSQCY